jgi:MFS superfamily sulfate permease-like transporter
VAAVAVVGVMILGVVDGMFVAVALSIAATLQRISSPTIATLGKLGESRNFTPCARPLSEPMKIASFNINNINRRLSNLLSWLREAEPDIVCLQELKAADTEFPADAIRQAGYHAVWRGEKRWNGVAILARWVPVVTRTDLPGGVSDGQCRYLEAAVNGVLVASIYAPIVPTDLDIYPTRSWDRDALLQPHSQSGNLTPPRRI